MLLADAEGHHGVAAVVLRLGPVLPVTLVGVWACAVARRRTGTAAIAGAGACVALVVAATFHLALGPDHAAESLAAGAFFVASAFVELALAAVVWRRPSRGLAIGVAGAVAVLVAAYAAARIWALPFTAGREDVDAVGLVTKCVEMAAVVLAALAAGWRWSRLSAEQALAAVTVSLAFCARPLFHLGPSSVQALVALAVAWGVVAVAGTRSRAMTVAVVRDAAVAALIVRADGIAVFVALGLAVGALRLLAAHNGVSGIAPVALSALAVLAVPMAGARMEILHVGHASEPIASTAAFVIGGVMATACWRAGILGPVAAFYVAHLGAQAYRLLAGRTGLEAVEVPAASLGLFLIVTVALAGAPEFDGVAAGLGAAVAGVADVILRDLGVAYAPLIAVAAAVAVVGAVATFMRREPGHASPIEPSAARLGVGPEPLAVLPPPPPVPRPNQAFGFRS